MPRSSRQLRPLILCLLLGIATTLALAILLAAFRPVPMYPRHTIGTFEQWGRPWNISEVSPIGVHDIWWMDLNADVPGPTDELLRANRRQIDERPATIPRMSIRHSPPSWGTFHSTEPKSLIGSDTAFGFPLPCLWYTVSGRSTVSPTGAPAIDDERLEGGLLIRGSASARLRTFAAIPYRPLWGRLAINSLALGVLWWLILFVPGHLRRAFRRRAGRCPACGYDLRATPANSPCPECGFPRNPLTASTEP